MNMNTEGIMKKQDYSKLSREELERVGIWAAAEEQMPTPYDAEIHAETARVRAEFMRRGETSLWQKVWRGE